MYSQVAPPDNNSECCIQNEGGNVSGNQSRGDGEELKDDLVAEKPAHVSKEKWLVCYNKFLFLICVFYYDLCDETIK